jgi:hypothetical protein
MMFMVPNKFKKETLPRLDLIKFREEPTKPLLQSGLAAGQTMKKKKD